MEELTLILLKLRLTFSDQQLICVSRQRVCVCLYKAIMEYILPRLRSSGTIKGTAHIIILVPTK